jgi:DNA glycosylase AlkZ-like
MVRTLKATAEWVDEAGLALLFPKADVVLPSLWEQVAGEADAPYAVREADGTFVRWADGMEFLWRAKDELPARGLVCVGRHLARATACVAPRLIPVLVAQADRDRPEGLEAELVDAIRSDGPLTAPELRGLVGAPKKDVDRRIAALHRRLVLTSSHLVEQEGSWGALAHDLLERKWPLPRRLPAAGEARRELALIVLRGAGELTAADLGGALGWRRRLAAQVLDEVAPARDAGEFRIWTAP